MLTFFKRIGLCGLALALGWGATEAQELNLQVLIDEALANNPELSTLKHRWEAFETRVPQAGALDDPMFKLEASNLPLSSFDYNSTPMSGNQLVLSQKFPFPGTLSAKERAARHASTSAESMYLDREGAIVNRVKQAYFTLAFLDRSIAITENNQTLLKALIRIAQTKYAVGRGLQQDVLKAQVALSGLMDRLIKLKTMRRMAEARLNLVLNRSPQSPVGAPREVNLTRFEMNTEAVQQVALKNRPLLKAVDQTIRQWQATEDVAKKQLWPNFTFSLGYRQRAFMPGDPVKGSDFLSFGAGVNLPIFQGRKQRQKISEARANIRMAEAQHESARQKILFQVQMIYLEIEQHRDEAALFQTAILPQAKQSLKSAMAGYQVDKVDFLTLLNNQVTLFNFEIDYYRHVTAHEKQLAELEAVVGTRLF
ncbi:MAG: TolC family protein [bacterium]|nr:TolC family protein [bacterium]